MGGLRDTGLAQSRERSRAAPDKPSRDRLTTGNQIFKHLPRAVIDALSPWLEQVSLAQGDSLYEPGDEVTHAYFPLNGMVVTLVLPMRDGRAVEAATVGREGVLEGFVSLDPKPSFVRTTVQIGGDAVRIPIERLEKAKRSVPELHDILSRYTDCLMADVLQSVGCASIHPLEARCARWLLMAHDRVRQSDLPLTQEALAETFGVARTYMTRIARSLQKRGAISYSRGIIQITNRDVLEDAACECYRAVRGHFDRVLPGLYPDAEP
jgi:CRP-like cAMP-binding protein